MRIFLALALAAGSAVVGAGRDAPPRETRIQNLVIDASGAPPEFEADALLRIANSSAVDGAWRRELVDSAFLRAYGAQEPYRRSSIGVPADSRQGAMVTAFDTRLTQVSLQVRAVQMMAAIDAVHARELFQWIVPGVAATSCEDVLVPAVGEYYTALSVLARTTFSADDRAEAIRFLEYFLWRAHLPSEMPAVAQAIQRFHPTVTEAAYFEMLLRFILEGGIRDPRGFSVAVLDVITRVNELEDADVEIGVFGRSPSHWLRDYLRKYLTDTRCADSVTEPVAVSGFNARIVHTEVVKEGVSPLTGDDVRASRLVNGARIDFLWQTPDSHRLQQEYLRLRGNGKDPIPERQRRTQAWREQAERFVMDLDRWNGGREAAERDYFYEKGVLFTEILALMPPASARTRGLRAFIDFVRHADMDRNRRALWFVFANRLLEFAHDADRDLVLDAMESSGHPTLSLYARLERLFPEQARTRPGPIRSQLAFAQQASHP